MVQDPSKFDVLVMPNLYGDILRQVLLLSVINVIIIIVVLSCVSLCKVLKQSHYYKFMQQLSISWKVILVDNVIQAQFVKFRQPWLVLES